MSNQNRTGWSSAPKLADLQADFTASKPSHNEQVRKVTSYLDALNPSNETDKSASGPFANYLEKRKPKTRSTVQNKTIRKQAEWRYTSLSEPFLNTPDVFNVDPARPDDVAAAKQNGLVLNNQINTQLNKVAFIDELVRTDVDEGTAVIKVGWDFQTATVSETVPVFEIRPAEDSTQVEVLQAASQLEPAQLEDEIREALQMSQEMGIPYFPFQIGEETREVEKVVRNQPTWEVCYYENIYVDPTCNGDLDKAQFVIHSFETSKSELEKSGKYENLDKVNWGSSDSDHSKTWGDSNFSFTDEARKKVVAYEYWGYWDVDGSGKTRPIVATWVGSTLIRMEDSPYPDGELPFVFIQFMPVRKSVFGEPDGVLLKDNQDIAGAITRGMIDLFGRSANSQTGFRKGALDTVNRRRFERGLDYEFNDAGDAQNSIYMHTFPEIPASAYNFLQMQNTEAESLTGVLAFNNGVTGQGLGSTAAAARGALSAAARRELGILRRLAEGMKKVARKFIAMNQVFLSEEEVVRITEDKFVTIRRDDLQGKFDIRLSISTAEADEQKASELSFMLQTTAQSLDIEFTKMLLSQIAELRKMPLLAQRIEQFNPQPDPMQQQQMMLEIELKKAEVAKLQAEAQKILAEAQFAGYKAANTQADTDAKNLSYVNDESGITHAREMEKMSQQAEANARTEVIKSALAAQQKNQQKTDSAV